MALPCVCPVNADAFVILMLSPLVSPPRLTLLDVLFYFLLLAALLLFLRAGLPSTPHRQC